MGGKMNRDRLVESAQALKPAGEKAYQEYSAKEETLVALINTRMLGREDINDLVKPVNLQMMQDNHANHVRFISSILHSHNGEVLMETVLWVFRAYRSRGFHTGYWAAQINAWMEILPAELSPDTWREVRPLYEWMQVNIPLFSGLTDTDASTNTDTDAR
jgi:hypothetical protein